ncbi:sensor histidine kinase [soil metagenome]
MQSKRWWHVAVLGTAIVLAAILVLSEPEPWQAAVGGVAIVAFVASWFLVGWRCGQGSPATAVFLVVVILFSGAVTLANPTLAIVQCVAFPLVWTRIQGVWAAVVANFGVAIAVGSGMYLATASLMQSVVIEALSLAFSIGLGLWITSIATQSDERRRLLDELRDTQAQLALVNRDAGVTSERDRLAREIHDTIAQDLTGIVLVAQRASRELAGGTSPAASLELLEESARAALAETRSLVAATASPGLEGGLPAAVKRLAERFERETGVIVGVVSPSSTSSADRLDRDTEVVLLRVAQEGLANVRKHSGASRVTITIDCRSLTVSDNGRGFDTTAESTGFGIVGMRERLALVDGTVHIASGADGTTVRVTA